MEMVVTFQLARARDRDRRATLNISEPTVNRSTFYCTVGVAVRTTMSDRVASWEIECRLRCSLFVVGSMVGRLGRVRTALRGIQYHGSD